jgi:hypothetical protein
MTTVRVVHREGNTGWGPPIKPYKLKPGEKVLSSRYTSGSGNYECMTLIIEGPDEPKKG